MTPTVVDISTTLVDFSSHSVRNASEGRLTPKLRQARTLAPTGRQHRHDGRTFRHGSATAGTRTRDLLCDGQALWSG